MKSTDTKEWYEKSYHEGGFNAQRRYPNEELLRFLGKYFFNSSKKSDRKNLKVLEVGCGSCANLWVISKEGFDSYGIDLSSESLKLGKTMLSNWECTAQLKDGSFLDLPYENDYFDIIIDVFSLNCVNHNDFKKALSEVYRTLKTNGLFFSYTPGENSSTFIDFKPSKKIDPHTLNGIYRSEAPFHGNNYPFHFWDKDDYVNELVTIGFKIEYAENILRSYNYGAETFEHIVTYARKK